MFRFRGDLAERFELNIKEEPDYAFQRDVKDDSLLNFNEHSYQPQDGKYSSKSLSGLTKKLKKRNKYDIKKRKQNILNKIENKTENNKYLKIFNRKSFKSLSNIQNKKYVNYKASYKDNFTHSENEDLETETNYTYPTNIINQIFFAWTIKLFRSAQKSKNLKFGIFSNELSADQFLKEILPKWESISSKTKSNPLLKTIIRSSLCSMIFIFFMCILVSFIDIMTIVYYRQVLLLFESNGKDYNNEIYFPLLSSIVILLSNKLFHIFLLRFFQFYTLKFGTKITIQINTLIYDKLLKISPYASISEGNIVNFIQLDAEKLGDFFSYIPLTVVLPLKIFFFVYLLFKYFGLTFILGLIALIMILFFSIYSQGRRAFYQKELLKFKDQRMKTTTQVLNTMKIIKYNSWEKYFYDKIKAQREIELIYLKKMQTLTLFINAISLSTSNITSLVSILTSSFLSSEMSISNILTSLYIFNSLGEPLFLFPEYISGLLDSMISLKRLETFLFSKEYNKNQINKNNDNDSKYSILIDGLDFGIIKEEIVEEEIEKSEDKKTLKENEEKELEDISIDDSEKGSRNQQKSPKIDNKFEFKKLSNKFLETYSEKGLPKIDRPRFRPKKFYSSSKRLIKTSLNVNKLRKTMVNISRFSSNDEDNLNIEKEREERDKERDKDKSSIMISLNEDSQSIIESAHDNSIQLEYKITIPLLSNITLKVEYGDLIGIIGDIGSGKTCLLNAILNNLDILNYSNTSKIIINGSISYVPQTPWIINDTIRGNILFNKEYDDERYQHIVKICELEKDFYSFLGGDFIEIGEKGVNLSGGQKIRISMARAVYSNSDIYLFDDPLSPLDPSIRNNIFHNVIKGYLKSKTILIATHALQYIPSFKHVIHMKHGKIDFIGTAKEAMRQYFYKEYIKTENKENDVDENNIKNENDNININEAQFKNSILNELNDTDFENMNKSSFINNLNIRTKKRSLTFYHPNKKVEETNTNKDKDKDTNLPNFRSLKVIIDYSGGIFFIILLILINVIWKSCESGSDYILMLWSAESRDDERKKRIYLATYSIMSLFAILFIFFRTFTIVKGIFKFNKNMHNSLLEKLLKAPINLFHDIIPRSHVLNRLSKDLDNSIRFFWSINSGSRLLFELLSCLIIAFLFNVFCVIPYPLMLFMEYRIFLFYIKGGRALNFLETFTRSSIITKFSETLNGISSIRGFEYQENFRKKYHEKLDDFYKVLIYQNGTSGWFALNLDLICFFLLFFILTFSWIFQKLVNPIVLGLLIGYTLKMIENTYGFFEQYINFEKMYSSMDNCEAYTHIVQEKNFKLKYEKNKKSFIKRGEIIFKDYSVKYRPNTDLVLKNINFTINPGEKIGIVGRTGSGKSTLCLALFRILEASKGKILIDNIDISQIDLRLLRDSISLIPQDPKLIDGTLRENIDPLGEYSDDEIAFQLNLIGLAYLIEGEDGLNVEIEADGSNFSVGEKQLICITRAMLKKTKIIIMDEANSSFDYKTDMLIQKCLMKSFQGCTLITIAHKIKTIIEYDRIFVLEDGELVETGKPEELIAKKEGLFYDLYLQSKI